MNNFKFYGVLAAICIMFSSSAYSREFADIYTDCGLGAMIAPNNEAVAAVTNVTWDLGTTAITSDASSEDTCKGGNAKAAAFIYKSYASLENELAKGNGQHLSALYNIMGCSNASHGQLTASLRGDFAQVVAEPAYENGTRFQKSQSLYNVVSSSISKDSSSSCTVI